MSYPQGIASVTCGQEAVFYDGQICLGGGVIDQVFKEDKDLEQMILERFAEVQHG